jgi:hypothetical protein
MDQGLKRIWQDEYLVNWYEADLMGADCYLGENIDDLLK